MDKNDLLKYAGEYIKLYPKKETNYFGGEPQIGYLVKIEGDLYLLKETKGVYLYTSGIESVEVVPNAKQENIKKFTQVFNENEFREKVIEEPVREALKKVKPYETRNDRFREFEFANDAKRIIDAKSVKSISIQEAYNVGFDVYVDTILMKKSEPYIFCKELYNDLVEWWKYWKQN